REFRSMLEYKAAWYGREAIAVDRFFLRERMPLSVRAWMCGNCGMALHRDVNAAKNLLAAGLAATVCGAGVRPQRSTPGRRSAMKQKTLRREP
ncbi:zinc ribbon domain-containing protein, partial [Streptomyces sp. WM6386]|uniref:zinc ribbon domain-containing protein n=1 Tax=Streptomyces sp. WM6386 TaxID=1415558 RepID=UPI0006199FB7